MRCPQADLVQLAHSVALQLLLFRHGGIAGALKPAHIAAQRVISNTAALLVIDLLAQLRMVKNLQRTNGLPDRCLIVRTATGCQNIHWLAAPLESRTALAHTITRRTGASPV